MECNGHSYDLGRKPFNHDVNRGKWTSKWDFYLASIGHVIGLHTFALFNLNYRSINGVFFMLLFIIFAFLFIIPMYFIQSSIGQFSGTGYISTFRIAPLFKGIGYVTLLVNLLTVSLYSVITAYPLWYFFNSFSWDLPWLSCVGKDNCMDELHMINYTHENFTNYQWSTVLYFRKDVLDATYDGTINIIWKILGCSFLIWIIIYFSLRNGIKSISPIVRYSTIMAFILLLILFVRTLFLPNIGEYILAYFSFDWKVFAYPEFYLTFVIYSILTLGSGWGTVITMASYNDFKLNTVKYSIAIPFIIYGIISLTGFITFAAIEYLESDLNTYIYHYGRYRDSYIHFDYIFYSLPLYFGHIDASHFWSLIFFLCLIIFEINGIIIQMLTIITAVFDEYEVLRNYKKFITIGLCTILALACFFHATNKGFHVYLYLMVSSGVLQMFACFLELMIVVWIYGRIRFQRDMEFMLGQRIPTFIFWVIRLISPLLSLFWLIVLFISSVFLSFYSGYSMAMIPLSVFPFLSIIGYLIYKIVSTTGTIPSRFRKNLKPVDWYPASPADREIYDRLQNESEITHQLLEVDDLDEENTRTRPE